MPAALDCKTAAVDINPDNTGPNLFYVRIVNKAGNMRTPWPGGSP